MDDLFAPVKLSEAIVHFFNYPYPTRETLTEEQIDLMLKGLEDLRPNHSLFVGIKDNRSSKKQVFLDYLEDLKKQIRYEQTPKGKKEKEARMKQEAENKKRREENSERRHQEYVRGWHDFLKQKYPANIPQNYKNFYPIWEKAKEAHEKFEKEQKEQEQELQQDQKRMMVGPSYAYAMEVGFNPDEAKFIGAAIGYAKSLGENIDAAVIELVTKPERKYAPQKAMNLAFQTSGTYHCSLEDLAAGNTKCVNQVDPSYLQAAVEVESIFQQAHQAMKMVINSKAVEQEVSSTVPAINQFGRAIIDEATGQPKYILSPPSKVLAPKYQSGSDLFASQIERNMQGNALFSVENRGIFSSALNAAVKYSGVPRNTIKYGGKKKTHRSKKSKSKHTRKH